MSTTVNPKYFTLEEYLALERSSDARYEYLNGQIFLMSGGSHHHNWIISNIHTHVAVQLEGRECEVFSVNQPIKVPAAPPYRYADGGVVCGEEKFEDFNGTDLLLNPIVIWEVLSHSTETYDRGDKFRFYKSIPTLREYLLISQDRPRIEHYTRQSARKWDYEDIEGLESKLLLPSIGCTLEFSKVYRRIRFE